MASWAPAAFLGVEVNKLSGADEPPGPPRRRSSTSTTDIEMAEATATRIPFLDHHPPVQPTSPVAVAGAGAGAESTSGELSGIYFGILNIYTTIPQFIGTLLSTVVFAILEPGQSPELAEEKGQGQGQGEGGSGAARKASSPAAHHAATDGPNAIAVVLFIGAIGAVMAIFATRKLRYL